LSGLLNLTIIALKQLIKDKGFIHVDDVHSIQREYNQNATTIEDFLNKKCRIDLTNRDDYTICRDVYYSYVLHCKDSNKLPVSDNIFGGYLVDRGIKKERKMVNRVRGIAMSVFLYRNNGSIA
jgi:hypothetical protein